MTDRVINLDQVNTFLKGIKAVLSDDGFRVQSPSAMGAIEGAHTLLDWSRNPSNKDNLILFVSELFSLMKTCIPARKFSYAHCIERIMGEFHQKRCSPEFKKLWFQLLEKVKLKSDPIFYQYVTDFIFKSIIKEKFPVIEDNQHEVEEVIGYEEQNVIRYMAGYVLRSLQKKLNRSLHPLKKELLFCLIDLLEESEEKEEDETMDWVNMINRGGLIIVSSVTFMLFLSMEMEVKHHISTSIKPDDLNIGLLSEKITSNCQVQYFWEELSVNWGDKASSSLLAENINVWITIRGYAYTSKWMEQYKSNAKKDLQKSKGIRKTLIGKS